MPKLQCPKCKQPIEIKSLPADNKVKCGSCSAEFALKAPAKAGVSTSGSGSGSSGQPASKPAQSAAAAKPPVDSKKASSKPSVAKPSQTAATADPNDPFAALDLNTIGKSKRVDFGVAPVPAGVSESPVGNNAPWLAENKPAYKPLSETEAAAMASGNPYQAAADGSVARAPKKSNLGLNIFVIVVLVAMAGGSLAAAIMVAMR